MFLCHIILNLRFFYNEGLENIFLTTKAPSRIVTLGLQDVGTFILVNNAPLIHVHAGNA